MGTEGVRYDVRYMNFPSQRAFKQSIWKLRQCIDGRLHVIQAEAMRRVALSDEAQATGRAERKKYAILQNNLCVLTSSFIFFFLFRFLFSFLRWEEEIEETGWIDGVRKVIKAVSIVVLLLQLGEPVILSSPHGRDLPAVVSTKHTMPQHSLPPSLLSLNTSLQVSSLTQLCLDPYYRTIRGFCVLIEKEWMSQGKWHSR